MFKNVFLTLSLLCALGSFELNAAAEIVLAPIDANQPNLSFFDRLNEPGKVAARHYCRLLRQFEINIQQQNPLNLVVNPANIQLLLGLNDAQILQPLNNHINDDEIRIFFDGQINEIMQPHQGIPIAIDRPGAEIIFLALIIQLQELNFRQALEFLLIVFPEQAQA